MRGVSFFRKRKAAKEYDIRIKAAAGRLLFRPVFESLYLDGEVYVLVGVLRQTLRSSTYT
jgi:hypothetical protein